MYECLYINDFEAHGYEKKISSAEILLKEGKWSSLNVRKLEPGPYYRVALDDRARMLFRVGTLGPKKYLLFLEVLANHEYEKSRFLRGKTVTEKDFSDNLLAQNPASKRDLQTQLTYVNSTLRHFHLLDKIISFDEVQNQIYRLHLPLIVIGSAGSGKTALVLERMKTFTGQGLYVTLSKFLAENSRRIYYSHGFDHPRQEIDFLSFKELLQSVAIPSGKEVHFSDFLSWWNKNKMNSPIKDPHKLFEEFQGVLTGSSVDRPYLEREEYCSLGVKQSIFLDGEREIVYGYFEKFIAHLQGISLFSLNIESYNLLNQVEPKYDFIVVDEIQDLTNIQVQFVLKHLLRKGEWIFCGDSNQIVHPNFFAWSKIKSLCYQTETESPREIIQILNNNFRNSTSVTEVANRVLILKHKRFGSIDKESNYLVKSKSQHAGITLRLPPIPKVTEDLDKRSRRSTRFAIIVPNEDQKIRAKDFFKTPLIFTVHEAKGLEYDNIVLFEFFSSYRAEFTTITEGVKNWDEVDQLQYLRAKEKSDKSLEVYKFFINSLYVGMTRTIENLLIVDALDQHRIYELLKLPELSDIITIADSQDSTLDEWRAEAQRLEKQGKLEQALDIHKLILGDKKPVPWAVLDPELFQKSSQTMMIQSVLKIDKKERALLFEFALQESVSPWITLLLQGKSRSDFTDERKTIKNKYYLDYLGKNFKNLEKKIGEYGVDFRNQFNQTPLHVSCLWGVSGLIQTLRDQGSDAQSLDTFGRTPLSVGIFQGLQCEEYMSQALPDVYGILSETPLGFQSQRRLVKVMRRSFEYFLFHLLYNSYLKMVLEGTSMGGSSDTKVDRRDPPPITPEDFVFDSETLTGWIAKFPDSVVGEHRKRREYISSLLSKNEIARTGPYNRGLFVRIRRGYYAFNPNISIAQGEDEWTSIGSLMNLDTLANTLQLRSAKILRDFWRDLAEVVTLAAGVRRDPAPEQHPIEARTETPGDTQLSFPGF